MYTVDVIPQELGTYGVGDYRDSSLFARTQDGVCSLDLRYDSYILHSETPTIDCISMAWIRMQFIPFHSWELPQRAKHWGKWDCV